MHQTSWLYAVVLQKAHAVCRAQEETKRLTCWVVHAPLLPQHKNATITEAGFYEPGVYASAQMMKWFCNSGHSHLQVLTWSWRCTSCTWMSCTMMMNVWFRCQTFNYVEVLLTLHSHCYYQQLFGYQFWEDVESFGVYRQIMITHFYKQFFFSKGFYTVSISNTGYKIVLWRYSDSVSENDAMGWPG